MCGVFLIVLRFLGMIERCCAGVVMRCISNFRKIELLAVAGNSAVVRVLSLHSSVVHFMHNNAAPCKLLVMFHSFAILCACRYRCWH